MEFKWNKNAQTALNQIKEKKYFESVRQYTGEILLVGINPELFTEQHLN